MPIHHKWTRFAFPFVYSFHKDCCARKVCHVCISLIIHLKSINKTALYRLWMVMSTKYMYIIYMHMRTRAVHDWEIKYTIIEQTFQPCRHFVFSQDILYFHRTFCIFTITAHTCHSHLLQAMEQLSVSLSLLLAYPPKKMGREGRVNEGEGVIIGWMQ